QFNNQYINSKDTFYQISINHRLELKKKDDIDIGVRSVDDIKSVVTNFDKLQAFENDQTIHDLEIHLEAVGHFEKSEKPQKVMKHLKGFKTLLKHNRDMMSEDAYEMLVGVTDSLLDRMEDD